MKSEQAVLPNPCLEEEEEEEEEETRNFDTCLAQESCLSNDIDKPIFLHLPLSIVQTKLSIMLVVYLISQQS
jgi:hypothetical protein